MKHNQNKLSPKLFNSFSAVMPKVITLAASGLPGLIDNGRQMLRSAMVKSGADIDEHLIERMVCTAYLLTCRYHLQSLAKDARQEFHVAQERSVIHTYISLAGSHIIVEIAAIENLPSKFTHKSKLRRRAEPSVALTEIKEAVFSIRNLSQDHLSEALYRRRMVDLSLIGMLNFEQGKDQLNCPGRISLREYSDTHDPKDICPAMEEFFKPLGLPALKVLAFIAGPPVEVK